MEGLQRSTVSFRRSGSSGLVWDDKLLNQLQSQVDKENSQQKQQETNNKQEPAETTTTAASSSSTRPPPLKIDRSRSNGGGRGFRAGKVPQAVEPPSPKLSACACCTNPFGKTNKTRRRPPKSAKRVM